MEAHQLVCLSHYSIQGVEDVDSWFSAVYTQSERMGDPVGTSVDMPRATGQQQHRTSPATTTPSDYFKRSLAIPFLDHTISSLESQFSDLNWLSLHLHC